MESTYPEPFRLGFGCAWAPTGEKTWSYIPASMRGALAERTAVVDLDPRPPAAVASLLKVFYMRRGPEGWRSLWKWSRLAGTLAERRFVRQARRLTPDAVLQIGDYGDPGVPFYLYQDLSFGTLERRYEELSRYMWLPLDIVKRRREHQERLYQTVGAVFTMSEWLAEDLRDHSGIDPLKVQAVGGGMNVSDPEGAVSPPVERHRRRRLLFIGRDFFRKGGDLVVEAFARLRPSLGSGLSLTVAGPSRWPLPGPVPDGVTFLGEVSLGGAAALYRSCDLFVMPSRFEPFGLVFVEALANGLPCIGRADFAMPELIRPGENGELVTNDDPDDLAERMRRVLADDAIYGLTRREGSAVRERYSWDHVAAQVLGRITNGGGPRPGAGPPRSSTTTSG